MGYLVTLGKGLSDAIAISDCTFLNYNSDIGELLPKTLKDIDINKKTSLKINEGMVENATKPMKL